MSHDRATEPSRESSDLALGSPSRPRRVQQLRVGRTDDPLEHEASRVVHELFRTPAAHAPRPRAATGELAPAEVHEVLASQGRPLDARSRALFEPRLGVDLGRVRVHDDARAARTADAVGAAAYTVGNEIAFAAGRYAPGTGAGDRLLAHELVHVAQQSRVPDPGEVPSLRRAVPTEVEADVTAELRGPLPPVEATADDLSVGPARPEDVELAMSNLRIVRQIITDVHIDLNTVLIMLQNLEEMEMPAVLSWALFVDLLEEGADAIALSVSEDLETTAAIVAFVFKIIVLAVERHFKTTARNKVLEDRNFTIEFLLEQLTLARTEVDSLIAEVPFNPALASEMAVLTVPPIPGKVSTLISGHVELVLMKSLIKRQGGFLSLEETDSVAVDTRSARYEDTNHYRIARERHADPTENWYLERLREGTPLFGSGHTYWWEVWIVWGVLETVVAHALRRMQVSGIAKEELYKLHRPSDLPIGTRGALAPRGFPVITGSGAPSPSQEAPATQTNQ